VRSLFLARPTAKRGVRKRLHLRFPQFGDLSDQFFAFWVRSRRGPPSPVDAAERLFDHSTLRAYYPEIYRQGRVGVVPDGSQSSLLVLGLGWSMILSRFTALLGWRFCMTKKRKMRGSVQKVIRSTVPSEPEKVQISVEEGDELYREIRIENVVTDEKGQKARLKPGAEVDVVIEADSSATIKKPD